MLLGTSERQCPVAAPPPRRRAPLPNLPTSPATQPLEVLNPVLTNPALDRNKPLALEIIGKLKPVLMAIYFAADHVVWAQQAGLLANKDLTNHAQKCSLYGWFGGSLCTIVQELHTLSGGWVAGLGGWLAGWLAGWFL